jgi:hypothetical protein
MTQHEYLFIAVSIILGLAITRLLHTVAMLIRAKERVRFHWSTAIYALSVLVYILQFWWVGWGLRELSEWSFLDFLVLVLGSICIYGAAEMSLPVPGEDKLDMLNHSQTLGRFSALSMLVYFAIGPYFNLVLNDTPVIPALALPVLGSVMMLLIIFLPKTFQWISLVFAAYSLLILALTA